MNSTGPSTLTEDGEASAVAQTTWFERDLPVLRAIVELDEESDNGYMGDDAIAEKTGLDVNAVRRAMKALAHNDPPFGEIEIASMAGDWEAHNITGHARRTVGQWPDPKTDVNEQVAALLAAFDTAADEAPDEESKSKIRAAAATFKGLPAQLAGAVSTAALLKLTGLA